MDKKLKTCGRKLICVLAFPLAFTKPMGEVKLSDDEIELLDTNTLDMIWQSTYSKSFLVWRRRLLCSSSVFYAVGAAIMFLCYFLPTSGDYQTASEEDLTKYTGLGKATLISQSIAPFCSLFVILLAAWFWTEYSKSRNILVPGWLLTLLLSLWPMMIPLNYLLNDSTLLAEQALLSATYAIGILPIYLSITTGMTLGFKRVFAFSPSPLSGAMVVLSAIFAIIIPFTALSMIVQLLGDYLLLTAFTFLVISPVIIVFGASHFTGTAKTFGSSDRMQKCGRFFLLSSMCQVVGLVFVLAWSIKTVLWAKDSTGIKSDEQQALAKYILDHMDIKRIIGMIFEFIGGMMFNAVLWTDIAVHVSRNDDVKMRKLDSDLS